VVGALDVRLPCSTSVSSAVASSRSGTSAEKNGIDAGAEALGVAGRSGIPVPFETPVGLSPASAALTAPGAAAIAASVAMSPHGECDVIEPCVAHAQLLGRCLQPLLTARKG